MTFTNEEEKLILEGLSYILGNVLTDPLRSENHKASVALKLQIAANKRLKKHEQTNI